MMKTHLTLLVGLFIMTTSIAQQGINYKAVITDNLGNVIANDVVVVQFSILQGVVETNIYTETHTPTTDANGLVILNIGEGTQVSGDYATIDWGVDTHALNVQLNTGGGLVDMGTTTFHRVPYALHADEAANVFSGDYNDLTNQPIIETPAGLESIDEGNGDGWRLKGRNSAAYGNIGLGAVDFSESIGSSNTRGATGSNAAAFGFGTIASGSESFALGNNTIASNVFSTAIGDGSEASGFSSTAMGFSTVASGTNSTAMGNSTVASGSNSTARGVSTVASGINSTAMGNSTEAPGDNSFAAGLEAEAIGDNSVAMGRFAIASGANSIALGNSAFSGGINGLSMGEGAALADNSVSIGNVSSARGNRSVTLGYGLEAFSFYEIVLGSWNTSYTPMSTIDRNLEDRLFVIGNGTQFSKRNALTMLKSGKTGLGTEDPEALLHLSSFATPSDPQLEITQESSNAGARINFTNASEQDNRWTLFARADNTDIDSQLNFFYSGLTQNIMSLRGDGNVYVNGVLAHSSDRRLKSDIQTLSYGLMEVLQLEPKEYRWKDKPNQKHNSLGLIAQEVRELIPNVVLEANDDQKTLSVSYTELIPVLINAIKEQQVIIESQNVKIDNLLQLKERMAQIEALLED